MSLYQTEVTHRITIRVHGVVRTSLANIGHTLRYVFSRDRTPGHEGRFEGGVWRNWNRTLEFRPATYAAPDREARLREVVAGAQELRVVGSGHSFNAGAETTGTLLSLDRYDRVMELDRESGRVRVQAGVRLRDLVRTLEGAGLAIPIGGSTDAQSIGGLVATDLHGTGREHAYLSQFIDALRVVDSAGETHDAPRGSGLFNAAVGGMGACGVVTEVALRCIPSYRLATRVKVVDEAEVPGRLAEWQAEYDHLSFYYLGGVGGRDVRMNAWKRTQRAPSRFGDARETLSEVVDMGFSGFILRAAGAVHLARPVAWLGFRGFAAFQDDIVTYPAAQGYARRLFYRHDEIEHGVPFEAWPECVGALMAMLRKHPPTIVEVRFAPDGTPALLGPGAGRRTCFLELAPSLTADPTAMFREAEAILLHHGGQPHLGKWVSIDRRRMEQAHGERLVAFDRVRAAMDARGKFSNPLIERLLG